MPLRTRSLPRRTLLLTAGLLALATRPAAAQRRHALHADAADSTSWIMARLPARAADASLRTRDRQAELLLTDTALVIQFTDRGLDDLVDKIADDRSAAGGSRLVARMLGAGIAGLLDHGLAVRLSELREARREGNALVLEDRSGARLFSTVNVDGRRAMDDFAPDEADRFAAAVNRAIRRRR